MTKIECNGIRVDSFKNPIVSTTEYPNYAHVIDLARIAFINDHHGDWGAGGEFEAGPRFASNSEVMVRIVSACPTREAFDAHLKEWIDAGLAECARADHWYANEKDYGEDYV